MSQGIDLTSDATKKLDLHAPFDLTNTTSKDKIPSNIQPLLEHIIEMVKSVYDPAMTGSLYVYGSVVSGTFVEYKSDIDAVWISQTSLEDTHPVRRREWFNNHPQPRKDVTYKLDVIAMEVADIPNPVRAATNFSCFYNGLQYAGSDSVNFVPYIPLTKGDYLMRTHGLRKYVTAFKDERQEQGNLWLRPNFIKMIARCWFMKAYAKGCSYTQSIREMAARMEEEGYSDELHYFRRLYMLYTAKDLSEIDKDSVFSEADELIDYFEALLKEYNSTYAAWIRSGELKG